MTIYSHHLVEYSQVVTTTVAVFDICSSTVILEDLQQSDSQDRYGRLIDVIWAYLNSQRPFYRFQVNKFLGDGFILLFDSDVAADEIMVFLWYLTCFSNTVLQQFHDAYLDIDKLPRSGITIGVASGEVYLLESQSAPDGEVFGRPINLACRFQSSSNQPDQVNQVVVSREFFNSIQNSTIRNQLKRTTRALHNVSGDKNVKCYYMDFDTRTPLQDPEFVVGAARISTEIQDRSLIRAFEAAALDPTVFAQLMLRAFPEELRNAIASPGDITSSSS